MGLYVVSGCPRSGTSLMMDCLRAALGEERLMGNKFPFEHRLEGYLKQQPNEPDAHYAYRQYHLNNVVTNREEYSQERIDKTREMNPNGFWEHPYTCRGIQYEHATRNRLKQLLEDDPPKFIKIVSQGLLPSDPRYISKIIFMTRHPFMVAKSQERLQRKGLYTTLDGEKLDIFSDVVINSPEMFLSVTQNAARFFLSNNIEVLMVDFDDLIENPEEQLGRVKEFLGEGNFEPAAKLINPKLRRSYPDINGHEMWDEAKTAYNLLREQKYSDILRLVRRVGSALSKQKDKWLCVRYMEVVNREICLACKGIPDMRASLKAHAESKDVDWQNHPCAFEVAFDVESPLISIEESIENNFWKEDDNAVARQSNGSRRCPGVASLRLARAATGLRTWPQYGGQRRSGSPSSPPG